MEEEEEEKEEKKKKIKEEDEKDEEEEEEEEKKKKKKTETLHRPLVAIDKYESFIFPSDHEFDGSHGLGAAVCKDFRPRHSPEEQ